MKRMFFITIALLMFAAGDILAQEQVNAPSGQEGQTLALYYFHTSFRCTTCRTVEAESEKAFQSLYPEQFENGTAFFKAVNIEEDENSELVEKFKIGGQTLLLVKGENTTDLTDKGFLYAKTNPDKLKEEIRTAFENL